MIKNVFITGGTGLVGVALMDIFSENNFDITATFRHGKSNHLNINWVKLDLFEPDNKLEKIFEKTDVIVHNAACIKSGNTTAELEEITKVNIDFTKNILEKASHFNIEKIIFSSTFSFIKSPLPDLITEESELSKKKAPY